MIENKTQRNSTISSINPTIFLVTLVHLGLNSDGNSLDFRLHFVEQPTKNVVENLSLDVSTLLEAVKNLTDTRTPLTVSMTIILMS